MSRPVTSRFESTGSTLSEAPTDRRVAIRQPSRRFFSNEYVLCALLALVVLLTIVHTLRSQTESLQLFGDSEATQQKMRALEETKVAYLPQIAVDLAAQKGGHHESAASLSAMAAQQVSLDTQQAAIDDWRKLTRGRAARSADWRRLGIVLALFHKSGDMEAFQHVADRGPTPPTPRIVPAKPSDRILGRGADPFGYQPVSVAPDTEIACWRSIYGTDPLPAARVPELRHLLARLKLGWFENVAAAHLYLRGGLIGQARAAADSAGRSAQLSHWLELLDLGVLLLGTIGLLGLWVYHGMRTFRSDSLVRAPQVRNSLDTAPATASQHVRLFGVMLFPFTAMMQAFLTYLVGQEALAMLVALAILPVRDVFERLSPIALMRAELLLQLALYVPALGLPLFVLRRRIAFDPLTGAAMNLRRLLIQIGFRTHGVIAEVCAGAAGYLLVMPVVVLATVVSARLFAHARTPSNPADLWMLSAQSSGDRLLVLFVAAVAAPFAEETLFRGILYPALRGRLGVRGAVVLSSAIFAALHPTLPGGFLPICAVGIGLSLVYEWRRSLLPGMVLHGLFNGLITVTTFAVFAR